MERRSGKKIPPTKQSTGGYPTRSKVADERKRKLLESDSEEEDHRQQKRRRELKSKNSKINDDISVKKTSKGTGKIKTEDTVVNYEEEEKEEASVRKILFPKRTHSKDLKDKLRGGVHRDINEVQCNPRSHPAPNDIPYKLQKEVAPLRCQGDEQCKHLGTQSQELAHVKTQLQQLQKKLARYEAQYGSPVDYEKTLCYVFAFLSLRDMLNCRKMCTKWRDIVDSFLENHISRRPFSEEVNQSQLNRGLLISDQPEAIISELDKSYTFNGEESVDLFIETFENVKTNPFLGRSVTFEIDVETKGAGEFRTNCWSKMNNFDCNDFVAINELFCSLIEVFTEEYWDSVVNLLEDFGEHIWYVKIAQHGLGLTPQQLYKILHQCLPYLKNVKRLVVDGTTEEPRSQDITFEADETMTYYGTTAHCMVHCDDEEEQDLEEIRMIRLKRYIERNPSLPTLAHLESFEFLLSDGNTRVIQDAIMANCVPGCDQLLSFSTAVFSVDSLAKIPGKGLKEIKVIDRHDDSDYEEYLRRNHPGNWEDIKQIKAQNLEKICIKDWELKISSILEILCNFPMVCCLNLSGTVQFPDGGTGAVRSPNETVKYLLIKHEFNSWNYRDPNNMRNGWKWIDFYIELISYFPKLHSLHILEELDEPIKKGDQRFQCSMNERTKQVNTSGIWSKFESLEIVKLEVRGYKDDGEDSSGGSDRLGEKKIKRKTWSRINRVK